MSCDAKINPFGMASAEIVFGLLKRTCRFDHGEAGVTSVCVDVDQMPEEAKEFCGWPAGPGYPVVEMSARNSFSR